MAPRKKPIAFDVDSAPTQSKANRLVIPLTEDNKIDWESVRPNQRDQFLDMVNNDVTTLEHIGISHESGGVSTEDGEGGMPLDLTTENVRTFLDILSQTNALAFRMLVPKLIAHPLKSRQAGHRVPLQIDADIALSAFKLTEKQHEELDPRALRLAQKYVPAAAKKHLDIWMLAGMYLKYTADNAQNAIKYQMVRDMQRMQEPQPGTIPQKPVESDAPKKPEPESESDLDGSGIESLEPGLEPSV